MMLNEDCWASLEMLVCANSVELTGFQKHQKAMVKWG